jgi:hypothetical protein
MRSNQTEELIDKISLIGSKFSHINSIMLVGSASRGELRFKDNKVISDFEFVFFVDRFFKDESLINNNICLLSNEYCIQIDICFVSGSKEMQFPKRLFYYDLVASGKVIFGDDYVSNRSPLKASDLHVKDVSNIVFYRTLDILINSPIDSISSERLCLNMSYIYFYVLINEGILEKDFRSRFARIEALSKTVTKFQNPISELFFKNLGPDYYSVRSARMDANSHAPDNFEVTIMLSKIIKVLDHTIEMEVFSLKHNLTYIIRYFKAVLKNIHLLTCINILFSINPRKKLLKKIKKEFIERIKTGSNKSPYLKPLLLKNLYERNML